MQMENRLFDDLARLASGALNTLSGIKDEIETRIRERVERLANDLDLVNREEFDAVRAMAAKARALQEQLEARIAALESRIAALEARVSAAETNASAQPSGPHAEPGSNGPDTDGQH